MTNETSLKTTIKNSIKYLKGIDCLIYNAAAINSPFKNKSFQILKSSFRFMEP